MVAATSNLLVMMVEDCHSKYLEYSVAIETAIGLRNKALILSTCDKDPERNASILFQHDMLEAYYTHYYYFGQPIDKNRELIAAAAKEKAERLSKLEAERKEKKKGGDKGKKGGDKEKKKVISDEQPALSSSDADRVEKLTTPTDVLVSSADLTQELEDVVDTRPRLFSDSASTRQFVAPNITKYIWRTRMIDILRKRDDLTEMPLSLPGRHTRRHVVSIRMHQLDEDVEGQQGVQLQSFVEIDRGVRMPRMSRLNFFREIVRVEEKEVARLEARVKSREDDAR
jgi:hypothetical protein